MAIVETYEFLANTATINGVTSPRIRPAQQCTSNRDGVLVCLKYKILTPNINLVLETTEILLELPVEKLQPYIFFKLVPNGERKPFVLKGTASIDQSTREHIISVKY